MKFIPLAVTKVVGRTVLKSQMHSPTILFGVGIAGVVGTVVLACRATLKVDMVLDHMEAEKAQLNSLQHSAHLSVEDAQKDKAFFYARSGLEIAKLYAPAAALGIVSIGCLGGSHHILSKRNVAITAAYATVDKAFKEYRANIVEQYGTTADESARQGLVEVDEKVVDKNGKSKTVKVQVPAGKVSQYARIFDEGSRRWQREQNYNEIFINVQQQYANDLLQARGHVFLNEVYDSLGLERSKAGQVVGWVLGNGGDDYIDFGIFKDVDAGQRVMNGHNAGGILLDFNVDGIVYDLLP